jgi:hypothetical protein
MTPPPSPPPPEQQKQPQLMIQTELMTQDSNANSTIEGDPV